MVVVVMFAMAAIGNANSGRRSQYIMSIEVFALQLSGVWKLEHLRPNARWQSVANAVDYRQ